MPAAEQASERADVEKKLACILVPVVTHDGTTAFREKLRGVSFGWRGFQGFERVTTIVAQEPGDLGCHAAGGPSVVSTMEQDGRNGKYTATVVRPTRRQ